jgi:hypothetical protein
MIKKCLKYTSTFYIQKYEFENAFNQKEHSLLVNFINYQITLQFRQLMLLD